jgi:hypothetical protein
MPQPPDQLTSRLFRERAEETRALAAAFKNEQTRRLMLAVAADYERMAKAAERTEAEVSRPASRQAC